MTCSKCGAAMEEGFVAGSRVAEWIQGPLEKSLLFGVKTDDRERREIRTFRCVKCGFLESYAN